MAVETQVRYEVSTVKILGGLEPVRKRPSMLAGCANPVLLNADDRKALAAIVAFEDTLLLSFKHHKVRLAVMMRRLKRYRKSLSDRAGLIMQAIAALSRRSLPTGNDAYERCKRFLMLTAQHDDAMRACPAASLSNI